MRSHTKTSLRLSYLSAPSRAHLSMIFLLIVSIVIYQKDIAVLFNTAIKGNLYNISLSLFCFSVLMIRYTSKIQNTVFSTCRSALILLLINSFTIALAEITANSLLHQTLLLNNIILIFWVTYGNKFNNTMFWVLLTLFACLPIQNTCTEFFSSLINNNVIKILSFSSKELFWQNDSLIVNNSTYNLNFINNILNYSMHYILLTYTMLIASSEKITKRIAMAVSFYLIPIFTMILGISIVTYFGKFNSTNQFNNFVTSITITGLVLSVISVFFIISKNSVSKPHNIDWHNTYRFSKSKWLKTTIVATCILATIPYLNNYLKNSIVERKGEPIVKPLPKIGSWVLNAENTQFVYNKKQGLIVINEYIKDNNKANITVHSFNNKFNLLDLNLNFNKDLKNEIKIISINKNNYQVQERITRSMGETRLNWSFYHIHNKNIGNNSKAILIDKLMTIWKHERKTSLISISTKIDNDATDKKELLYDVMANLTPEINKATNVKWLISGNK